MQPFEGNGAPGGPVLAFGRLFQGFHAETLGINEPCNAFFGFFFYHRLLQLVHQRFEDPLPVFAAVQKIGKPDMAYREAFDPCLPRPLRAEAGQRFRKQAGRERQYAFEPFKLAFRGAAIVRTVIKAGVHGPENSLGERIGRQIFNAFEHGGFGASVGEAEKRLCSRKPFISGLAGGQFVQYGGAFFAEFRLIGADQGQREAQTAEAGQVRLAFAAGLAEAFLCFPERGHGVPAFQEGDDALKQGASEFRPVEQQRHNLGAGFRVASGERVEQDQCRAGGQIRQ